MVIATRVVRSQQSVNKQRLGVLASSVDGLICTTRNRDRGYHMHSSYTAS